MFKNDVSTRNVRRPRASLRRMRVRVVEGPDAGVEQLVDDARTIAVGGSADNGLRLSDPTVSRYHVEAEPTVGGIRVWDLGSRNGTYYEGVRIGSAVVPPGTRLRLGTSVIALEDAGTAEREPEPPPEAVPGIVAASAAMQAVARQVHRLAPTSVSVLLQGETGTGKEVVARAIHGLSSRGSGPFVVVDCGSMAPSLIASELFGHERGAFTSADRQRAGAFERAHGGTLLLDEVGELPSDVQPALLGVLERRRFRRVGGEKDVEVDVRIIAATNRDLRAEANEGTFRPDLYFRLAVARIVIPPLRERPEDIEPLANHFARQITEREDFELDGMTRESFRAHHWGGNVRELRNAVESMLAIGEVELGQAPPTRSGTEGVEGAEAVREHRTYREARAEAIARFEHGYLGALIAECEGNASEAARRAHMDRAYLVSLLKKHGLR